MSESETGLMTESRESSMPFTMALHHQQHNQPPSPPPPPPQQQQQLSPPPQQQQYQHNSAGGGNQALNMNMPVEMTTGSEPVKKRRGRPRKYGPEPGLVPRAAPLAVSEPSGGGGGGGSGEGGSSTQKKMRGRPRGSINRKKLQALGSTGVGFTPHVLTVGTGEDVASKIMEFSQNGPRTVCVLSANGSISNVTLRRFAASGGTVTYEGRFEILSLTGSFHLVENSGHRSRSGGLSVSLSAPDGHVLGGCVAGLLIAASPVQIVVGSFIPEGQKEQRQMELAPQPTLLPRAAPSQVLMNPSSPHSRGTMSESSIGGHGSPLHQHSGGPYNNNTNNPSMPWN